MNETQRYLAVEHYEDFHDGLISRRELLRRLTLLLGTSSAAAAFVAACGGGQPVSQATTTPAAATTAAAASPTAAATASPAAASPGAVAYATPPASGSGDPVTVRPDDPRITAGSATIKAADGADLIAYLARPRADGRYPGILVMHENRGLLEHIRDVSRRVATAGFAAVAIDVLSREGGADRLSDQGAYNAALAQRTPAQMVADFRAAIEHLRSQPYVDGAKIGATGFCFGGGTTWHILNAGVDVQAAVPFYGPVPQDTTGIAATKAAVLGVFAETDSNVNSGMPRAEDALKRSGATYRLSTYPGTSHAFHNDTGARFNPEQARRAWVDTIEWFRQHLT